MSEKSGVVELGAAAGAGGPELGAAQSAMELLGFAALGLIGAYVAFSLARYYLPGFRPLGTLAGALGLRDR